MAVIKVEEFRGDHNKLYLTFPSFSDDDILLYYAKKRFRVANKRIVIKYGWTRGNELFLTKPENDHKHTIKMVWVAFVKN